MPKENIAMIYEYLFKEGVMVAKKDFQAKKHPALPRVPNLHVIKCLQSLKSRGYVKEQFAWRHFYWYLTNEGIQFLRDYLHLPPEIVPPTLRRSTKPIEGRPERGYGRETEPDQKEARGRPDDGYRRGGFEGAPQRTGFGRGRPPVAQTE